MTSWSYHPPPRRHERLAVARDVAIIAVCIVIVGFALLAFLGTPREAPPLRRTASAEVRVGT